MKQVFFLIIILGLFLTSAFAQAKQKLTKLEAAQRFVEFVKDNGYTDLSPTQDKSKLVPESVYGGTDDDTIKFLRHNTLERKPIRITKGNRLFKNGWSAIFLYKQPCRYCSKNTARIIYMDAYGQNIKVEHQDIFFKN